MWQRVSIPPKMCLIVITQLETLSVHYTIKPRTRFWCNVNILNLFSVISIVGTFFFVICKDIVFPFLSSVWVYFVLILVNKILIFSRKKLITPCHAWNFTQNWKSWLQVMVQWRLMGYGKHSGYGNCRKHQRQNHKKQILPIYFVVWIVAIFETKFAWYFVLCIWRVLPI